jgi:glutaredoxin-like protein NrdH
MTLNALTIYTSTPCPACTLTKRHLTKRGIPFTEVPIDSDEGIRLAAIELDLRSAPIVCASTSAGEIYWDGFRPDRIDALVTANANRED